MAEQAPASPNVDLIKQYQSGQISLKELQDAIANLRLATGQPFVNPNDQGPPNKKRGGRLTAAERKRLPKGDFAVPSKAPKSGSFPIEDEGHAKAALARSAGKPVEAKVRGAVKKKFPGMQVAGGAQSPARLDRAPRKNKGGGFSSACYTTDPKGPEAGNG